MQTFLIATLVVLFGSMNINVYVGITYKRLMIEYEGRKQTKLISTLLINMQRIQKYSRSGMEYSFLCLISIVLTWMLPFFK